MRITTTITITILLLLYTTLHTITVTITTPLRYDDSPALHAVEGRKYAPGLRLTDA